MLMTINHNVKKFIVDTSNDVLATGPMPKMILNVFNDKEEV